MRNLFIIMSLLFCGLCIAQTKEQLLDTILTSDTLESDCVGIGCTEGLQYLNFKKLKSKLSEKELVDLTKHKSPFLRMYASIDLLESDKGNVVEMFEYELKKYVFIHRIEGCLVENEPTYAIIYHHYYNKIMSKVYEENLSADETFQKQEKLILGDKNLEKMDMMIINSKKELNWFLYSRVFENRIFSNNNLDSIEKLAFMQNNSYALLYLKYNHPKAYANKVDHYIKTRFISANFNTENGILYLHSIIEYLLDSENEAYKQIALQKLKTDDVWKLHEEWFKNTLQNFGITL